VDRREDSDRRHPTPPCSNARQKTHPEGNAGREVGLREMLAALLLILLLLLLLGGLGILEAKVFLFGLLIALIVGLVASFGGGWRGSRV
jgi:hypothetical protein